MMPQGGDGTAPSLWREAGWIPLPNHGWWPQTAPSLAKSAGTFCLPSRSCLWEPSAFCGEAGGREDAFFQAGRDRKVSLFAKFLPSHLLFPINGEKKPSGRVRAPPTATPTGTCQHPRRRKGELNPPNLAGRDAGTRGGWKTTPCSCSYISPTEPPVAGRSQADPS